MIKRADRGWFSKFFIIGVARCIYFMNNEKHPLSNTQSYVN